MQVELHIDVRTPKDLFANQERKAQKLAVVRAMHNDPTSRQHSCRQAQGILRSSNTEYQIDEAYRKEASEKKSSTIHWNRGCELVGKRAEYLFHHIRLMCIVTHAYSTSQSRRSRRVHCHRIDPNSSSQDFRILLQDTAVASSSRLLSRTACR